MSKILITGAGSGFGRLTSEALRKAGHAVVGTMRDVGGRNREAARALGAIGVRVVEMDVTDDASTQRGVDQATSQLDGLDVVINNAGVGALGISESFTLDDWRRVFEVNVFGSARVIRAVLPRMKEQKAGLLVQVSSLNGRMILPFQGPYNPSKWAVEAMAEGYRVELSQLGIESCIVEPGGMPTTFLERLVRPSDKSRNASYGDMAQIPEAFLKGFEQTFAQTPAQTPQLVADAIVDLIAKPRGQRPARTVVDTMIVGDAVRPANAQLEKITHDVYTAFGIGHLLSLKT